MAMMMLPTRYVAFLPYIIMIYHPFHREIASLRKSEQAILALPELCVSSEVPLDKVELDTL